MSVFLCDKETLDVLDKFLAAFYLWNQVNFETCFADKLIRWFAFIAAQKTRNTC